MTRIVPEADAIVPPPEAEPAYDPTVYKTLLESTKAIPWKIDWATMRFAYIGPQIEPLLGWTQDSWVSVEDWASRIHPDDRESVVNFCVAQSQAGVDHEADYRALTHENDYVWIRDVVHVVRTADGEVESLVGFMFDISEQKKTEQDLASLRQKLEALSFEDGLTGISNRRMFDLHLEEAFGRARHSMQPLSLIMLDIDYFKQYNDFYGHIQGDDCLRQIAGELKAMVAGAGGIAARYGGEEFALLLPETSANDAHVFAGRCAQCVKDLAIPHQTSAGTPFVTASFGVGTIVPSTEENSRTFVQRVDRLLYASKAKGRDRIEAAML